MKTHHLSVIHDLTEHVIRGLKRNQKYKLDNSMNLRDLLRVIFHRGTALLHGVWIFWRLGYSGKALFLGAQVTLHHKNKIYLGQSCIIEDHVFIDALSKNGVKLGNNVTIAKFSTLQCTGIIQELGVGIEIGDNSAIGAYSFLGGQGGIRIGQNVIMGPKVCIFSENHEFDQLEVPIRMQPTSRKGVVIEDNCWIGANATIVDGVTIHSGSVVAAGGVVTKDVASGLVVGGVPAKIIRTRGVH
jgi:acetyltransferase-like isoleucine patch superfamily enzyme